MSSPACPCTSSRWPTSWPRRRPSRRARWARSSSRPEQIRRDAGGVAGRPVLGPRGLRFLLGEDPGVLGPAVEDLRADAVELAAPVAPAAAPVGALEDGAE